MNAPAAARNISEELLQAKEGGKAISALTAYDYPVARILDEAGIDLILVGDSLGMVVLGYEDTLSVTMDDMLHHTRACRRGVKKAILVGDLPYQSYETPARALSNARRLVGAGADAVKLEGGRARDAQVRAIVDDGIPLVGHIGMLPQNVREEGGYKKKGKSEEEAARLLDDALALQEAGACAIVLESMVATVATGITASIEIPTIGIGAGSGCDGQVLVIHDLIGAFPWFCPPFATPRVDVAGDIRRAVLEYCEELKSRSSNRS